MSRRLPPRKRARFRKAYHRSRNRVYKRAHYDVRQSFIKERRLILEAIRGSLNAKDAKAKVKAILTEAHGAANWQATLFRIHHYAADEGANVTREALGGPKNPKP